MKKIDFKQLVPEQIEVRPTDTKVKGKAVLLLYIDSRSAADILNETIGEYNWTIEYKPVGDKVFGRLSIWDEDKNAWVFREDTGEESNISAEKGLSSDILKRCLARFGCDWLYHTPKVKINCPDNYYYNDKMTMTFSVKEIEWDEKKTLKSLVIVDKFGKEVYNYGEGGKVQEEKPKDERSNLEILKTYCGAMKNQEGIDKDELLKFYNYYEPLMSEWRMKVKPESLWNKWLQSKR